MCQSWGMRARVLDDLCSSGHTLSYELCSSASSMAAMLSLHTHAHVLKLWYSWRRVLKVFR